MGIVFNIQRYCLHDGEGIRTTVFFKGCPLRCIWCHNPEGLSSKVSLSYNRDKCTLCGRCTVLCSEREITEGKLSFDRSKCIKCGKCVDGCLYGANELIGKEMSVDDVIATVLKDKIYYKTSGGGMTLSGGEPSMQADFALGLIEKARDNGISSFVETCGIGDRSFYEKALELSAGFLFDIKCMDPVRHKELTGVSNERILSNLLYLFENGADVTLRLPMIPGINDSDEDISALCSFLSLHKGKYRKAEIMPYHSFGAAKSERLGKEADYLAKDASDSDKSRWTKEFNALGIDISISQ